MTHFSEHIPVKRCMTAVWVLTDWHSAAASLAINNATSALDSLVCCLNNTVLHFLHCTVVCTPWLTWYCTFSMVHFCSRLHDMVLYPSPWYGDTCWPNDITVHLQHTYGDCMTWYCTLHHGMVTYADQMTSQYIFSIHMVTAWHGTAPSYCKKPQNLNYAI